MRKVLAVLVLDVIALLAIGIVLLASASTVRAQAIYGDPHQFLKQQLVALVIAALLALASAKFDYHHWRDTPSLTIVFYLGMVLALALVFAPVVGKTVNGSHRWLILWPTRVQLQPSEFAKILTVVVFSVWFDRIGWRVKTFVMGSLMPVVLVSVIAGLLVLEPDFGSTMVVGVTFGALMMLAGTPMRYIIGFGAAGIAAVGAFVLTNANRMNRLMAFFSDSDSTENSAAYQLEQAIIAIKNGGLWGVGFNQSIQKYRYLPEAHTDFIFAIGAEEFGFIFSMIILLAFLVLMICGLYISLHAPDRLGRLMAFGMTFLLVFQALFNIAVVTGCLPTKGLALPFISYGGTNLMTGLMAVGMLWNIGRQGELNEANGLFANQRSSRLRRKRI